MQKLEIMDSRLVVPIFCINRLLITQNFRIQRPLSNTRSNTIQARFLARPSLTLVLTCIQLLLLLCLKTILPTTNSLVFILLVFRVLEKFLLIQIT